MTQGSGGNLLEGLPRWPALDEVTADLFAGIARGSESEVAKAIGRGGRLEAIEPYRLDGDDVAGGNSPLQLACSSWPGRAVSLEIIAMLLDAGANPNGNRSQSGLPLRRLASCLPSNAIEAADMLFKAGAIADAGMVAEALLAEKLWITPTVSTQSLPLAMVIWEMLPDGERQKLDPHLPTQLIGLEGGQANESGVVRAKWVLDRLAGVALDVAPSTPEQLAPGGRSRRPH